MRVVVIGAGVGGLAAAARLAAAGHGVTVCEQAEEIGGKLGRLQLAGATFDTGPSVLTMPHLLAEVFEATGAPLESVLDIVPVEPMTTYRFADGTRVAIARDAAATAAALDGALGAGAGDGWQAVLARGERIWDAVYADVLERPLRGVADLARLSVRLRDLATIAPHRTLRDLGREHLDDPRLRMLLDRYATYTGSDPRRAPAALAVIPHVEQAHGVWYVRGGLYQIAQALAERARERGAVVRTSAPVREVEVAGGRVTAVVLDGGERLPARAVVANADATHLYRDLVRDRRAGPARRRLAQAPRSSSGFVMLLVVRGRTEGLGHHTVLFPAGYDAEFDALFGPRPRPVEHPALYVCAPRDPRVTPAGHEALFVLANAPRNDQVDWDAAGVAEGYADRLVELLADRGVDVRDRVLARAVLTPADLERRTRAVGGAIYGTSSNGLRAAFLRPANRSPVPGLFLAGGSAHPGGGLPLVLLSARIVADLVGPA